MLAGVFLCAMTMLNIIGITHFVQIGPMALAVGVLPYPLTFLCTDLVSELYGKSRANFLVTLGLVLNGFILFVIWLAQTLPMVPPELQPPWQNIQLGAPLALPSGEIVEGSVTLFHLIYSTSSGAVVASMIAYIAAQYCDVQLFHFWKRLTNGRKLWLRNNFSTLISQGVDSFVVISITFGALLMSGAMPLSIVLGLMLSNYLYKMTVALLDTGPLYLAVHYLRPYLNLPEGEVP